MLTNIRLGIVILSVSACFRLGVGLASPSVDVAFKYKPIQKGVEPDNPTASELEQCSIKLEDSAWVVRGPNGDILRKFADSDGDNNVDVWSYYRDGLEIYRDIDTNGDDKPDQYRWFHWAGTRWGVNTDEDPNHVIDAWKLISPEETAEQVVQAIRTNSVGLFQSLLLKPEEIRRLGLSRQQSEELAKRSQAASATFKELLSSGKLDAQSEFSDFGGLKPGMVPAGTHGSTKDIMVYENAWAMVKTSGEHQQLHLGTMVSVKGAWKLVDAPSLGSSQEGLSGFFFVPDNGGVGEGVVASMGSQPSERLQDMLTALEEIDQQLNTASDKKKPELNATRAKILKQIAGSMPNRSEREQWLKQLADMVSAAVQDGSYPQGVPFLKQMQKELKSEGNSPGIVAYFEFHEMLAEHYGVTLVDPEVDYAKAQAQWQEDLEDFVERHPKSEHGAEALRMLAIGSEMSGQYEDAVKWYRKVLDDFPRSPAAKVAKGAVLRLTSEGREIDLKGKAVGGGSIDLRDYRGKVVVIQYWTSSSPSNKADHAVLSDLYKKYGGRRGLEIIGVNLDYLQGDVVKYLKANRLPWKQVYEPGGFDSRLASELGVVTVPLMMLVGEDGKVISNNIQASEIEDELKKHLLASRKKASGA